MCISPGGSDLDYISFFLSREVVVVSADKHFFVQEDGREAVFLLFFCKDTGTVLVFLSTLQYGWDG